MRMTTRLVATLVSLIVFHQSAVGAEMPSDLIVGRWKDRAEPNDAVIEFLKEGKGTITETTPRQTSQANISWKMISTYGNAGIVTIRYEETKSKEAKPSVGAKPMTWLIAFDGMNTFIMQPVANKIVFMDRQESLAVNTNEKAP